MENEQEQKPKMIRTSFRISEANREFVKKTMHYKLSTNINRWLDEKRIKEELL